MIRRIWYMAIGATVACLVMGLGTAGILVPTINRIWGGDVVKVEDASEEAVQLPEPQPTIPYPDRQGKKADSEANLTIPDEEILSTGSFSVEPPPDLRVLLGHTASAEEPMAAKSAEKPEQPTMSVQEHEKFLQQNYDETLSRYQGIFGDSQ